MGTALLIILGVITGFAVIAYIFSIDGEMEKAVKNNAIVKKIFVTENKLFLIPIILFGTVTLNAQEKWVSSTYDYGLEIPVGFNQLSVIGSNVDFKAGNGEGSIVVVVKTLPDEYKSYSIWDIMGDLSTYESEWEAGAQEYMENPDLLKYGETKIDGLDSFWYDYSASNPMSYSKVYQTQKDGRIYTFTLTSSYLSRNSFSAVWYRFKNKIQFL